LATIRDEQNCVAYNTSATDGNIAISLFRLRPARLWQLSYADVREQAVFYITTNDTPIFDSEIWTTHELQQYPSDTLPPTFVTLVNRHLKRSVRVDCPASRHRPAIRFVLILHSRFLTEFDTLSYAIACDTQMFVVKLLDNSVVPLF
jgi:hypothetical protein